MIRNFILFDRFGQLNVKRFDNLQIAERSYSPSKVTLSPSINTGLLLANFHTTGDLTVLYYHVYIKPNIQNVPAFERKYKFGSFQINIVFRIFSRTHIDS